MIDPHDVKMISCEFKFSNIGCKTKRNQIYLSRTSFRDCTFDNFFFDFDSSTDIEMENCTGTLLVLATTKKGLDTKTVNKKNEEISINNIKYKIGDSPAFQIDKKLLLINIGFYENRIMNEDEIFTLSNKYNIK